MAIPVPDQHKEAATGGPSALGAFTFATSNQNEPVRTYDPDAPHDGGFNSGRASAPASDILKAQKPSEAVQAPATQSESNTTGSNLRGGDDTTPTHSTDATSYLSDKSEDVARQRQKTDFEVKRNRAASAPMHVASPNLRPSYSMSSAQSSSRDSSKPEMNAMVFSNGDLGSETGRGSPSRDRKASTRTLGRKRSRIKMGLAFWKKKKSEDLDEEAVGGERECT